MAKKINTLSETWMAISRELDDRRQALLDELARLDTTEQRSAQIRGALGEINFILDLPEGPLPGSPDDV